MPSPFMSLPCTRLGDREILVPGRRRLQAGRFQHVLAVVHHVEVAIEGDHVGLAAVLLGEVAEEGADIVLLDGLVGLDARRQILEVAAGDVVDHPLRREDRGVDRVGAARPVGQNLLVEIGERHRDHVDLGAGQRLELRRAPLQRLLDRAGLGDDVHGHAGKRLVLRKRRRAGHRAKGRNPGQKGSNSHRTSSHIDRTYS